MQGKSVLTGIILALLAGVVILSLLGLGASIAMEVATLVSVILMVAAIALAIVGGTVGRERTTTPYW